MSPTAVSATVCSAPTDQLRERLALKHPLMLGGSRVHRVRSTRVSAGIRASGERSVTLPPPRRTSQESFGRPPRGSSPCSGWLSPRWMCSAPSRRPATRSAISAQNARRSFRRRWGAFSAAWVSTRRPSRVSETPSERRETNPSSERSERASKPAMTSSIRLLARSRESLAGWERRRRLPSRPMVRSCSSHTSSRAVRRKRI
ncbi:MAG: hypothetical protein ACI8RZ_006544 [Myxococcota bacterium]|jgi:hypothetical protein